MRSCHNVTPSEKMSLGNETMAVSEKSSGAEYGAVPRSKDRRLGDELRRQSIVGVGKGDAEGGFATEDNISEEPKSTRRRRSWLSIWKLSGRSGKCACLGSARWLTKTLPGFQDRQFTLVSTNISPPSVWRPTFISPCNTPFS